MCVESSVCGNIDIDLKFETIFISFINICCYLDAADIFCRLNVISICLIVDICCWLGWSI